MDFGLHHCQTDHSFVFHLYTDVGYILLVYVDGLVIIGDDFVGITKLKQFLQQCFHTKDED
jgi:hypothetical protein